MKIFFVYVPLLLLLCIARHPLFAQKKPDPKVQIPANNLNRPGQLALTQTGDPALDHAIRELYAVISGPAGHKRDWEKFRAMFAPGAQMGVMVSGKNGEPAYKQISPEEYIATSGKLLEEKGFFESEISRKIERYGNLVHLWSTYEAREKETDTKPMMRGVNSIQFVKIGNSYKIASLIWQPEAANLPLPADYLPEQAR